MKQFCIICTILLLIPLFSFCQSFEEMKAYYPDDNGVLLKQERHLVFSFDRNQQLVASSTNTQEIMILKENAISAFNSASVYHSFFNVLGELKAATLVPDPKRGYKEVKSVLRRTQPAPRESVFYDDAQETEVTFVNTVPGAITRLNYTMTYPDIHLLPAFYFASFLPVYSTQFSVTFPKELKLGMALLGGADTCSLIRKTVREDANTTTITWEAQGLPRAKTYNDAPSTAYYLPHIMVYVEQYTDPAGKDIVVLNNINALYQYLFGLVKKNINEESDAVKTLAQNLTEGLDQPAEKAAAIYKWVQRNVRYIAYEDSLGGFVPRVAGIVCQRKFGDCKDMANLLRSMCRAIGLDARVVWIGTRTLPYTFEQAPVPAVFNHMIAAVRIDGKWVIMDGTDPTVDFGQVPYVLSGKEGLIEEGDHSCEIIKMPTADAAWSTTADSCFVQIDGTTLKGSTSILLSGFSATDMASYLKYKTERDKKDLISSYVKRGSNKFNQNAFTYTLSETLPQTVSIHSEFDVRDYVNKVGEEYYINLNLDRTYEKAWVDTAGRNAPVELLYKAMLYQVVELQIPEGYKVSYLPPDGQWNTPELVGATFHYEINEDKITLSKRITVDALYIPKEKFADFNAFISAIQQYYRESVILSPK